MPLFPDDIVLILGGLATLLLLFSLLCSAIAYQHLPIPPSDIPLPFLSSESLSDSSADHLPLPEDPFRREIPGASERSPTGTGALSGDRETASA